MNTIVMKCPNCGANVDFDEGQEVGFCKYCGTKVIRENPNVKKIKIENPIKIDGKIQIDNSGKYEYQLRQADTYADEILSKKNPTMYSFYNVYNVYSNVEELDGSDSRVYTHRLNFIINFFTKRPDYINSLIMITHYNYTKNYSVSELYEKLLKDALDVEKNENKKLKLKEEYSDKINELLEKAQRLNKENAKKRKQNAKKFLKIFCIIFIIGILMVGSWSLISNKLSEKRRAEKEQEEAAAKVFVPNLIGKTVSEAEQILNQLGIEYEFNEYNPGVNNKNYASTEPDAIVQYQHSGSDWVQDDDEGITIDKRYNKLELTAMTEEMINHTGEYYIPSSYYGY